MRLPPAFVLLLLCTLPVMSSCSALRSGNPIPAGYEADKQAWTSKYIPGYKSVSEFIPPPSDARTDWDRWHEKKKEPWKTRDE